MKQAGQWFASVGYPPSVPRANQRSSTLTIQLQYSVQRSWTRPLCPGIGVCENTNGYAVWTITRFTAREVTSRHERSIREREEAWASNCYEGKRRNSQTWWKESAAREARARERTLRGQTVVGKDFGTSDRSLSATQTFGHAIESVSHNNIAVCSKSP
jgi:hypothetical protein